jgi:hypothetical protein
MIDAGGSYLSLPSWIPFGKQISYYVLGIGMGRYLAAALGVSTVLSGMDD